MLVPLLLCVLAVVISPTSAGASDGGGTSTVPADRYGVDLGRAQFYREMPQALDRARDAGIGWTRIALSYGNVEPRPNEYDWSNTDPLVSELRDRGIRVLARITPAVWWNTTAPPGQIGHLQDYPPKDYHAFAQYVSDTVSRYRDDIHYWEVGNEMNTQTFWHSTPAEYAHLLAVAHDAIKSADPSAKVLIGGVVGKSSAAWLTAILEDPDHPAADNFDVAAFHSYQDFGELAQRNVEQIETALSDGGVGDRPLWVTETGASADPEQQSNPAYKGPEGQAQWLRDRMALLASLGADKVFWFKLMDLSEPDEHNELGISYAGLLDYDLSPRPALDAYADVIAKKAKTMVPDQTLHLRHGDVKVKLRCPDDSTYDRCKGSLKLRTARKVHAKHRRRRVTLGRARYSLAPGGDARGAVHVPRRRRSLVGDGLKVKVSATSSKCPVKRCQRTRTVRLKLR